MPHFGVWVYMPGCRIITGLASHRFWPEQPLSAESIVSDVFIWYGVGVAYVKLVFRVALCFFGCGGSNCQSHVLPRR